MDFFFHHQHRDAVNEKDNIGPDGIGAVGIRKLVGNLEDIGPSVIQFQKADVSFSFFCFYIDRAQAL